MPVMALPPSAVAPWGEKEIVADAKPKAPGKNRWSQISLLFTQSRTLRAICRFLG